MTSPSPKTIKDRLYEVIFLADTKAGRRFDVILLILIIASVLTVMLDSVFELHQKYKVYFLYIEWIFTFLFSLEYIVRIIISRKPFVYIKSFYGVIDLLSILPTYVSLIVAGGHPLLVIRILRMLRIFRVLKLSRYLRASRVLRISLGHSKYKIIVFLEFVITTVVVMGSFMYLIEGPENGFSNIPKSIYWAIVTLTTVGFGDITPQTILGQFFASIIMILGYSVIAVPTGIISAEIIKTDLNKNRVEGACKGCAEGLNDDDAKYCKYCGRQLDSED
jgi:voltage-gated potassium channel